MATLTIPRSAEQLTPEWLTAALRERGVIRDATVTSLRPERIGAGAGFLGQLVRLRAEYSGGRGPATVIAKMPTLDPGGREICRLLQFYEREIRFYDGVAPRIGALRVPKCYFAAMDIEADDYLLILEDITDARIGDEVAGCSAEEAERAVRRLAEFHRGWWETPDLERLEWMPYINGPATGMSEGSYQQAWEPFLQMFGDRLSPRMRQVGDEMRTRVIDMLNEMALAPRTIVHGDYSLDNIFFSEGDGLAVIDWQISSRGRGMFDVAYFLASCVEPDVRRAHERRLVELWYDAVRSVAGETYSFDDAWEDYRRAVLFTNVYTVVAIGALDAANERGTALFEAWFRRRNAAIEELDAGELMPR